MTVALYIENERIDLFPEDNIEIVSSIADSSDITKLTTDYSKSFSVPASDTNNRIFKHYYNATIDNTFDARIKTNGRIEIDGLPFKSGKIQLEKVNVKSLKASSYSLRFFGKLVAFKDKVKDDELPSLDLSALNFEYTQGNIITALTSSLISGKLMISQQEESEEREERETPMEEDILRSPINTDQFLPTLLPIEALKVSKKRAIEETKMGLGDEELGTSKFDFAKRRLLISEGDIRLSEFKRKLNSLGIPSRFQDGALLINDSILVQKDETNGKIQISGKISKIFFQIREMLYGHHTLL
jgi:hypothetical protein